MSELRKEITAQDITTFIEGHDPMEHIVNMIYDYQDDFMQVVYRNENDQKLIKKEPFYPFLWATYHACDKLCGGDRNRVKQLLSKYGIRCIALSNTSITGEVVHEFDNGYRFKFQAKNPMSYSRFLAFFREAQNPVFSKKDKNGKEEIQSAEDSRQYLIVTPQEQFMIATGKRFFKGYDDYDQILKMTIDLETTGLNTKRDRIIQIGVKMNRPFPNYPNGFQKILTVVGNTKEDKDRCELWAIDQLLKMIYTFKPDIITAHNGENFDWNMLIDSCTRLGTSMAEMSAKYFNGETIRKEDRESSLKLGGEIQTFYRTIIPGIIVTDSIHATWRAMATDSSFKEANLKYATNYLGMKKPNRVYTPGKEISSIWADNEEHYAFCEKDGDWYLYDKDAPAAKTVVAEYDLDYFKEEEERDRLEHNTVIPAETRYEDYLKNIEEQNKFKKGKDGNKPFVMYTRNYVADGYELKSGKYIIERYLGDDLWECERVEHKLNTTNFLICKLLPLTYSKATTMGTAGQWKALMLAWSYENNLAVPLAENSGSFTGGLSRLLRVGYIPNVVKLDYNSLYPSIILTWAICDKTDLMGTMLDFLKYVLTEREKYKGLKKKAGKVVDKYEDMMAEGVTLNGEQLAEYHQGQADYAFNDKKQAQMKVFGNSFFGSYGSNNGSVFPWKSPKCAEQTTCTGRQCLRLMISHFSHLGYIPIVGDTDGFNFQLPDESTYRYTKEHPYISTGESRETKKDEAYIGFRGDVAEFNDMYMKDFHYFPKAVNKMGLGIDEVVTATINFSRKNYADYFPNKPYPDDVKMVGNTIKSKKMPGYIEKFLAKGVRQLLRGEGQEFLQGYYDKIDDIFNYHIPYKDIATKGKVKKSISDYVKDCNTLTKAGRPKSRQAWMELALQENLHVDMGDTLYYVNVGKTKSQSDVKKVTKYFIDEKDCTTALEKEFKEYKKSNPKTKFALTTYIKQYHPEAQKKEDIILNCRLVPREVIDSEEDIMCNGTIEYNVAKYIDMFNKRITPLLVCFKKDIRSKILITDPDDRKYFTKEECKLSSGEPNKASDQDTYEQLMTMEDKEIKFWTKHDLIPPFVEECGMGTWDDIKADYFRRMEDEKNNGIAAEKESFEKLIAEMTKEDVDNFLEEGTVPETILKIADLDPLSSNFISRTFKGAVIGSIDDILDVAENMEHFNESED